MRLIFATIAVGGLMLAFAIISVEVGEVLRAARKRRLAREVADQYRSVENARRRIGL